MPTLCERGDYDISFGDSAVMEDDDPSRPPRDGARKPQTVLDENNDASELMNETTLSGSMIEAALQAMRIDREACHPTVHDDIPGGLAASFSQIEERHGSKHLNADENIRSLESKESCVGESSTRFGDLYQGRANHAVGQYEAIYRAKYAEKVSRWIDQGRVKYPNALCDYRSMSSREKTHEEERVMKLLSRLRIHEEASNFESANSNRKVEENDEASAANQGERLLSIRFEEKSYEPSGKTMDSFVRSFSKQPTAMDSDESTDDDYDPSGLLFSPPLRQPGASRTTLCSESPARETDHDSDRSSSTLSLENPRTCSSFVSPAAAIQRKRMASMSGKRGTDQVRLRTDRDCFSPEFPVDSDDSPTTHEHQPVGKSTGQLNAFSASQSPISPRCSSLHLYSPDISLPHNPSGETRVSLGAEIDMNSRSTPRSDTSEESVYDSRFEYSRSTRLPLQRVRQNITLKTGAIHHYKALETTCNNASRIQEFRDPLSAYDGSLGRRMTTVFNRLHRSDQTSAGPSNAILLSMSGDQIRNLSLKLLLSNPPVHSSHNYPESQRYSQVSDGQTLIVVRDKATLAEWITTFRQGSPFSVLDFFDLALRQRKSHSTAAKLSTYDIVLVTFDALKAPDVTYLIDESGHVIHQALGDHEGWLHNRASSEVSGQTKQYSVLHSLSWHRVIFVDMIGRKCFLAKPDTTRSMASAALNSQRRYIFLLSSDEDKSMKPVDIIQGDKKATASFASVLRHYDGSKGMPLQQILLDLHVVGKH